MARMKKARRFLAIFLALTMTVSLLNLTVFAEEGGEPPVEDTPSETEVIDGTGTGDGTETGTEPAETDPAGPMVIDTAEDGGDEPVVDPAVAKFNEFYAAAEDKTDVTKENFEEVTKTYIQPLISAYETGFKKGQAPEDITERYNALIEEYNASANALFGQEPGTTGWYVIIKHNLTCAGYSEKEFLYIEPKQPEDYAEGENAFNQTFVGEPKTTLNGVDVVYFNNVGSLPSISFRASGGNAIFGSSAGGPTPASYKEGISWSYTYKVDYEYSDDGTTLYIKGDCLDKSSPAFAPMKANNDVTKIVIEGPSADQKIEFAGLPMLRFPNLTSLTVRNVNTLKTSAFGGLTKLNELVLENIGTVEEQAFVSCKVSGSVTLNNIDRLGWSDVFNGNEYLLNRIPGIMAGKFTLDSADGELPDLTPDTKYTSQKTGSPDGDTRITKSAAWTDSNSTRAEVGFQFAYDDEQGMDILFLVDYSGSMTELGNDTNANARFYEMQSKIMDVAEQLTTTPGYDNRVAMVSFGNTAETVFDFTADFDPSVVLNQTINVRANTNYTAALSAAQTMIDNRNDKSRPAAIIFISDGEPTLFSSGVYSPSYSPSTTKKLVGCEDWQKDVNSEIVPVAKALQDEGVTIFGVLQTMRPEEEEWSKYGMSAACTDGLYFLSEDTEEFSEAVNNAIGAVYHVYTLRDVVDPAFELDESSIKVTLGGDTIQNLDDIIRIEEEDGQTVIYWTITGTPYSVCTLTYQADLKQENGAYPYGDFDTNEGDATVTDADAQVNSVETPVLTREAPYNPGPSTSYYNLTVEYVDEEGNTLRNSTTSRHAEGYNYTVTVPAIEGYTYTENATLTGTLNGNTTVTLVYTAAEDIPDDDPPLIDQPDIPDDNPPLEDLPDGEPPLSDLPDEEPPLADVPETGDLSVVWTALSALSGSGLAWLGLSRKRKDDEA